jgi:perosamine synthetase
MLLKDCAQAFSGLSFRGSSHADISMFSFGTIKTSTAFGGALVEVQNSAIRIEMKRREERCVLIIPRC